MTWTHTHHDTKRTHCHGACEVSVRHRDCDCDCDAGSTRNTSERRDMGATERAREMPLRGKHRCGCPLLPRRAEQALTPLLARPCAPTGSIHRLYERASLSRSPLALKKASIAEGLCTAQELAQLIAYIEESLPLESRGRVRNVTVRLLEVGELTVGLVGAEALAASCWGREANARVLNTLR